MTTKTTIERVVKVYQRVFAPLGVVTGETELEGDSLDAFHFALELEDEFDIAEIEDEEILNAQTIDDIVQLVEAKKPKA